MTRHANINYPQQTIKAALGGGLLKTEAKVACKVLNIMTGLGMPVSRRIA